MPDTPAAGVRAFECAQEMRAEWSWLPEEVATHVLTLAAMWFSPVCKLINTGHAAYSRRFRATVCAKRLLNRGFAASLYPVLLVCVPASHPRFDDAFVEGVIRIGWRLARTQEKLSTELYCFVYNSYYVECGKKRDRNCETATDHYNAIGRKMQSMLADRVVNPRTLAEQRRMCQFVQSIFRTLSRYWCIYKNVPAVGELCFARVRPGPQEVPTFLAMTKEINFG